MAEPSACAALPSVSIVTAHRPLLRAAGRREVSTMALDAFLSMVWGAFGDLAALLLRRLHRDHPSARSAWRATHDSHLHGLGDGGLPRGPLQHRRAGPAGGRSACAAVVGACVSPPLPAPLQYHALPARGRVRRPPWRCSPLPEARRGRSRGDQHHHAGTGSPSCWSTTGYGRSVALSASATTPSWALIRILPSAEAAAPAGRRLALNLGIVLRGAPRSAPGSSHPLHARLRWKAIRALSPTRGGKRRHRRRARLRRRCCSPARSRGSAGQCHPRHRAPGTRRSARRGLRQHRDGASSASAPARWIGRLDLLSAGLRADAAAAALRAPQELPR